MQDIFGARLKQLMYKLRMNQGAFASALGSSPSFISDITKGNKKPGFEFLVKISSTFNVSLDWLMTGKEQVSKGKIDFELLSRISTKTELAIAALDGDNEAISLINTLLSKNIERNAEFKTEKLKFRLNSKRDELRFIVEQYNLHVEVPSTENVDIEALKSAISRYLPFYDDPVMKVIYKE